MKFEDFGINVGRVRAAKNLSAYELSLRIGKDPSYIHKLENGKINPSLKTILLIWEILEVNITELFE